MFEIKNSRSEVAPSSMQESRRSVKLAEGLSKAFPDKLLVDADDLNETPNAGNFFKPSKTLPARKRTSIRQPTKRLEVNNSDHFMEMESGIDGDSCSSQDDGKAHSHVEPTNVSVPFSGVSPFSIENIDMRTKEGRMLKESIKAQVKKITVIKRAQNRSEQSVFKSTQAMKHEIDVADSSVQGDTKSWSAELPECQSNAFPNVLRKETENSNRDPFKAHLSKNSEKDVLDMTLARRSRKRQWRTNLESEPDMQHVVNENTSSHSIVLLPEDQCENLADTPRNVREHPTTIKEETHLRKSGMKVPVKKVTFDQSVQKQPAKINHPLEMNSETDIRTSSTLGKTESLYSADSTQSLYSTVFNAPADADDHLHDNVDEELLTSGLKEPIIKKSRKRQVKNNVDHPLEINSTEDCSLSIRAGSQHRVQLSETLRSPFAEVPAGSADDLQPSADKGHLFNATSVGSVKKMTLVKKPRNKSEKNNLDNLLQIKSGVGKDSLLTVHGDLEPCRSIETPEGQYPANMQPPSAENLHAITKEESLLKINKRGDFTNTTSTKNTRKRPTKNGSDHLHEMQKEARGDSALLRGKSQSSSINESPKGSSVNFSEVQADVSEHINTSAEDARLIHLSDKEEAQKTSLIKQARKRPTKSNNSNHKTSEGTLFQVGVESGCSVERPEGQCEFTSLPAADAGHVSSEIQLVKAKGTVQNVPVIRKVRKRPERGCDQMTEIKSRANGKDSSLQEYSKPLLDDYASRGSSGVQEQLCSGFSAVPVDASADHLQSKKEEGSLFKPEMQRAVKKMTLSQKPRTGLEKDCDHVLQMKSERVDDSVYLAQSNTVFRYSVELPESLCSGFPSAQQQASEAMDISTAGGRLCLFAASKNAPVKKRVPIKKAMLKPKETAIGQPHEMENELGDDASSLVLGDSESLSGLDLPENPCSAFPDVPPGASENMNLSADESSFLHESSKVCARNVTLIEEGVEESELNHLFEMKNRAGDDALVSVLEDSESRSSFEFPEVLGTGFPDVSPHTADPTEMDTEDGNLFSAIAKEEGKKRPLIKGDSSGPESNFDSVLEMQKEDLGSLLQEDDETRLSADVGNIDMLSNTNVDMSTEGTLLGLFDPDKKVRKRPPNKKQFDGQEEGTFEPLLKKRGRKKKEPEMEMLHDGEVRVKQKGKLNSKDHEGGVKQRKKGRVSESGFANDGVLAPDGETNLDFGEIFDTVLAEASKWERSKDSECLARLGFGEGTTGTGRLKAPPMSDNDLYSSGDEAEEALFGYSQPYEHTKLTSMKKHRECVQASQVEKRKTSPYFSKRSTEEEHPRDDVLAAGEDTISGYEDGSDDLMDPIFTDTDEESEDLDLGHHSAASLNGAGPSGLNPNAPSVEPGEVVDGVDVNCRTVEGAILKTEQKQLSVVKNINDQLRRMEHHLANLVKFNRLYIRRSIGLTGELVRENASQSLSLQRIAETLESVIPFPPASGIRLTADSVPTSSSSSVSSDSSDEEWAKRPSKTPKRAKRNREEGAARGRKKK